MVSDFLSNICHPPVCFKHLERLIPLGLFLEGEIADCEEEGNGIAFLRYLFELGERFQLFL